MSETGSDGSVSIEAEGQEDMLKLFKEWCKKGPLWANVKEVVEEEAGEPKNYGSFEISR
ncbi:MAG: acylphosphatase [Bacteroidales bacterium]